MRVLHIGSGAADAVKNFFNGRNDPNNMLFVFHDCSSFIKDTNGGYSKEVHAKKLVVRKWAGVEDFSLLKQSFDRICANYILTNTIYLRPWDWEKFIEKVDALLNGGAAFELVDSFAHGEESKLKRFFEKKGYAVEVRPENTRIRNSVRLTAKKPA